MSRIPSKDTKAETIVRKYLFSHGLRFRKNVATLPGKPDIVLPKYKTIVFVNGCFWHAHLGCRWFVKPKSNVEFWEEKCKYNVRRDTANYEKLQSDGWRIIIVWECEIRHGDPERRLSALVQEIKNVQEDVEKEKALDL